jgi:mRNA interferase MazF
MKRGDVVFVRFPHPSGQRGKKRPAVVVQSDTYATTVNTIVVAEVTKNLTMKNDPACLFIDLSTPEGNATGLLVDSVVSSLVLDTVAASEIQ